MAYLLQQLLSRSAAKYPDKDAVIYQDASITYSELEKVTNQLAHLLIAYGVKRGDRVGIYLHKSIFSIISVFAILKAGAVYVPIDPRAPARRSAYIIRNCGIKCLITAYEKINVLQEVFREEWPLELIILTDDRFVEEHNPFLQTQWISWQMVITSNQASLPEIERIDTDLAYILYTSGSTGDPKGVMISHLNAMTFVNWAYDCFHIVREDRLSNHAPLHFDLSIFDIFVGVKAGASIVLVPEGISTFPIKLAEFIEENRISVWYSVPSVLSMLVLHGNLQKYRFSNLRLILFAGDVFPVKYLKELMRAIPQAEYYNLYGPTETNVCTFYHVRELAPERMEPVPIGKACANTEVFAVNEQDEIVTQPGEAGELYVRGSSVAQGYWGDPEKTRSLFLPNRFQPHYEEKIYKTGDLVTLDDKGNYLYIGRKDHMIKSRGYRIELGEIETVLYSHSKVKEAAVIAIPDDLIGNRIKAFVVPCEADSLTKMELERYCLEHIPRYMLPSIIEFRDFLTKTSTGKIDRKLLASER